MSQWSDVPADEALRQALDAWQQGLETIRASRGQVEADLQAARRAGNNLKTAELLVTHSTCVAAEGDFKGAIRDLKDSETIYRKLHRREETVQAQYFVAKMRRLAEQDGQAKAGFVRVLPLLQSIDRLPEAADAALELGNLCVKTGEPSQALEHYAQALELQEQAGERVGVAPRLETLKGIATAHQAQGDVDGALSGYARLEAAAFESGDVGEALQAKMAQAGLLGLAGRTREADGLWTECLRVAREQGDTLVQGQCLGNLATSAASHGHDEEALQLATQARELTLATGDGTSYLGASVLLTALHARTNNTLRAYEVLANTKQTLAQAVEDPAQLDELLQPYFDSLRERIGDDAFAAAEAAYRAARQPS